MDIDDDDDSVSLSDPEEDEIPESILKDYLNFRSAHFNPILHLRCGQEVLKDQVVTMDDSKIYGEAPTFLNIIQLEKTIPTPSTSSHIPSTSSPSSSSSTGLKKSTRPQPPSSNKEGGGIKNINLDMAQVQEKKKGLVSSPLNPDPADVKEKEKLNANVEPEPHYPMPGRRFLAHQMPVYRPPKKQPNFHTIMKEMEGPLARLRVAIERGKRIKVWTRNETGFRGFTIGFPIAFDKHWNLALRDVDEIIQRKRKGIKLPALANTDNVSTSSTPTPTSLTQKVVPRRSTSSTTSTKKNQRNPTTSSKNILKKSNEMSSRPSNFLIDGPDALFTLRFAFEGLSLKVPPPTTATTTTSTTTTTSKDIIKLKANKEKESSKILVGQGKRKTRSTTLAESLQKPTAIKSTTGTDTTTTTTITRSQIKKKGLVIFKNPIVDANGFKIVGHSKKFELIERHCAQQLLFGDNVILIEVDFS